MRCCDSLTKSSPNDQNLKACCMNINWNDKNQVCPCDIRSSIDRYPRCCSDHYNDKFCCKNKGEYNSAYAAKCCIKTFDTTHCCGDFSVLDQEKQKRCCNSNYVPEKCCSLKWVDSKCCSVKTNEINQHISGCCAQSENQFSKVLYKKNCCKPE